MNVERGELAERGYTVVRGVAPEPLLAAARSAIERFLGVELARPEAWYPPRPLSWGVVPLHHSAPQWELRQLPALYDVFVEILGTPRLWVSMDRAIYRVPASELHPEHVDESILHWDVDPRAHRGPAVQGMLFLTDTPADQGPFEGVPGLFADLAGWLARHPDAPWDGPVDLEGHAPVPVPARAGDLVVWDTRLPHRGAPNRGRAPRMSVAITMWPEGPEQERRDRVRCWRERRAPAYWRDWPGIVDPELGPPAPLTPLGQRLVGLERW